MSDDAFASGDAAGVAFTAAASTIAKRGAKILEKTIFERRG
jgi:hypothetical protein